MNYCERLMYSWDDIILKIVSTLRLRWYWSYSLFKNKKLWKWSYPIWLRPQDPNSQIAIIAARIQLEIWKHYYLYSGYDPRDLQSTNYSIDTFTSQIQPAQENPQFFKISGYWSSLTMKQKEEIFDKIKPKKKDNAMQDQFEEVKTQHLFGRVETIHPTLFQESQFWDDDEFIQRLYWPLFSDLREQGRAQKMNALFNAIHCSYHDHQLFNLDDSGKKNQDKKGSVSNEGKKKGKKKKMVQDAQQQNKSHQTSPLSKAQLKQLQQSSESQNFKATNHNLHMQQQQWTIKASTPSTCSTANNDSGKKKKRKKKNCKSKQEFLEPGQQEKIVATFCNGPHTEESQSLFIGSQDQVYTSTIHGDRLHLPIQVCQRELENEKSQELSLSQVSVQITKINSPHFDKTQNNYQSQQLASKLQNLILQNFQSTEESRLSTKKIQNIKIPYKSDSPVQPISPTLCDFSKSLATNLFSQAISETQNNLVNSGADCQQLQQEKLLKQQIKQVRKETVQKKVQEQAKTKMSEDNKKEQNFNAPTHSYRMENKLQSQCQQQKQQQQLKNQQHQKQQHQQQQQQQQHHQQQQQHQHQQQHQQRKKNSKISKIIQKKPLVSYKKKESPPRVAVKTVVNILKPQLPLQPKPQKSNSQKQQLQKCDNIKIIDSQTPQPESSCSNLLTPLNNNISSYKSNIPLKITQQQTNQKKKETISQKQKKQINPKHQISRPQYKIKETGGKLKNDNQGIGFKNQSYKPQSKNHNQDHYQQDHQANRSTEQYKGQNYYPQLLTPPPPPQQLNYFYPYPIPAYPTSSPQPMQYPYPTTFPHQYPQPQFYMPPGGFFSNTAIQQPVSVAYTSPAQQFNNFFISSPSNNLIISPPQIQMPPSQLGFPPYNYNSSRQDKQHLFFKRLDIQIKKYTNAISEYIKQLQREHTIIIGDIKDHLRSVFGRKSNAKMFGSLATGLAAMSSDMDIAVLGVTQPTTHAMEKLKQVLEEEQAFQDIEIIRKTTVPVIKLKVNLKELRKSHGLQMQTNSDKADELKLQRSNIYKVDIAFDDTIMNDSVSPPPPIQHRQVSNIMKGLKSCQVIKGLINTFYPLKPLVLILKKFLSKFDLNVTYYGGLNSYSLVIMVISLINYYKQSDSKYIGRLLHCFFGFYSNFDYNKYQIQINGQSINILITEKLKTNRSYIPIQQQFITNYDSKTNRSLIVVDPLDQTNNTARASFQFKKIFCYFRAAYEKIQKLINSEIHQDDNKLVTAHILKEIESQQILQRAEHLYTELEISEQSQKSYQQQMMGYLGELLDQTINVIGKEGVNNNSSSANSKSSNASNTITHINSSSNENKRKV